MSLWKHMMQALLLRFYKTKIKLLVVTMLITRSDIEYSSVNTKYNTMISDLVMKSIQIDFLIEGTQYYRVPSPSRRSYQTLQWKYQSSCHIS